MAESQILFTENIDMFRHPKYYKELRKLRNKLDQAISHGASTEANSRRAPGPGPKRQAQAGDKPQAQAGNKPQAQAGNKPQAARREKQASSPEEQASSLKP